MPDRRIDAHAHLVPDAYRRQVERRDLVPYRLPPCTPELLDDLMVRHAIDASIVSLSPPGVWFGDPGLARELARMANEQTAELVRSDPTRFAGLAVLPLPDVDDALNELGWALDHLGLDGVMLLSNVAGVYPGDPACDALWAELERRGAYVFLHPTEAAAAPALPDHPVWLYEFPFETTRAVVNLIYSGTLARSPNVRLQVSHLGGTVPFLAHRIASLAAREPERAAAAPAGALDAIARLYYDTGLSNHPSAVEATRAFVPLDHIVFGTDWPYAALPPDGDPAAELSALGVERALVDGRNAGALVPRLIST